jgi:competence protein ComEA
VGPVLAQAIVAYRLENGAFLSADQLLEIPGLGPKILEKNEKSLLVDGKAHKN